MPANLDKIANIEDIEVRMHNAAIWYINQKIPILPVLPGSKALPRASTGINYSSASCNIKTIDKWFNPIDGKFRGYNIGIACGKKKGFFVLDVDQHDDDGKANLDRLMKAENLKLPNCPIQLTPRNGQHYLFRWAELAENSTSKIAEGVDTRGGTSSHYKSHVVAFPSMIDDKMYVWSKWVEEIPVVPDWVVSKLGKLWSKSSSGEPGRGNEEVTQDDIERPIDEEQIERMLKFIDPNDCSYDEWLKIGMSIKSQLPYDDGLELWDEWSKGGERYRQGECFIRWDGFSDFGAIRAGTLFHYAQVGGWKPTKEDKKGNPLDRIISEMNQEFAVTIVGAKFRILCERASEIEIDPDYILMEKESFQNFLQNQKIDIVINGELKKVSLSSIWLGHEGRRTYKRGLALFPNAEAPDGYFNTWAGLSVEPKKGDCSLFLAHIRDIICGGEKVVYEWVLDWVADLFQFPEDRKGCAIVMRGQEGSGKGAFAETIGMMFGPHYRHLINDKHLTSNFNAHMLDAIVVFADEITWGGNKKDSGILKGLVTEPYLMSERKGVDANMYRNLTRVFVASNSEWVIPAGKGSRRWTVIDVIEDKCRNRKYFNALFKEIESGGREAILHYFLNRTIKVDLRRSLETSALREQRMLNTQGDTVFHWWRERILSNKISAVSFEGDIRDWPELVTKMDFFNAYKQQMLNDRQYSVHENVFGKKMREYGVYPARKRILDGTRVSIYKIPKIEDALIFLNKAVPGAIEDEDDNSDS